MRKLSLVLVFALGISGCGDGGARESLSDLAENFGRAMRDSGPRLQDAADNGKQALEKAKDSEDAQVAVKGAACTSLQIYANTGYAPNAGQFGELMFAAAVRNHISIPAAAALKIRSAALGAVSEAQQAVNNRALTPAQAAGVISGDLACTASNILPPLG